MSKNRVLSSIRELKPGSAKQPWYRRTWLVRGVGLSAAFAVLVWAASRYASKGE